MCPIYMVADNRGQEFDYIIVGAGSAGCVLAARLSEDPNVRVAPLEAGGPDDAPEISLPVAFPQLFKTNYDWDFATEPEPGLKDRRIYLPRGRTLGGSSAMNAMTISAETLLISMAGRTRCTGVVVRRDAAVFHQVRGK
jgi:choline dehydrogenase-like flavoprotein